MFMNGDGFREKYESLISRWKNTIEEHKVKIEEEWEKEKLREEESKRLETEAEQKRRDEKYAMLQNRLTALVEAAWIDDIESVKKLVSLDREYDFEDMKSEFPYQYRLREGLLYHIADPDVEHFKYPFPAASIRWIAENYHFPEGSFYTRGISEILYTYRNWEKGPEDNPAIDTARFIMEKYSESFPAEYKKMRETWAYPYGVLDMWNDWSFEAIVEFYELFF